MSVKSSAQKVSNKGTTSVRLEEETARRAKLAAAAARESLVKWMTATVRERLNREDRVPASFKVREVSVTFDDPWI